MDSERVERLETSLSEVHAKLDLILKQLSDQTRPLQVMEDHVYNVESIAANIPFLGRFSIPSARTAICERKEEAEELTRKSFGGST